MPRIIEHDTYMYDLRLLSRQTGKTTAFWNWVRRRLKKHDDFCVLCPTLKRAKEITKQMRKLVIELNSKSKVKITHPFEKKTGQFNWWEELW